MYEEWPFFNAMVSNTCMALFKSNMKTAQHYAELCDNKELSQRVLNTINRENDLTIRMMLKVAQIDRLLSNAPVLELSLNRREPYLDPLGYIQINLLKKFRQQQEPWKDALLSSINAIAAAMRNTG